MICLSSCRLRKGSEIKIREWADMEREFPKGIGGSLVVASGVLHGNSAEVFFPEEMKGLCGQIFTVKTINYEPVFGTYLISVVEDTDGWNIWEPMIELKPMSAHCAADLEALFS